jgi:hypothetical protein
MASEEPKTAPAAEAPAAEAPAAETSTSEKKNNGKKGNRDERPIEELYDLSKPILRVSPCGRSQMTGTISVEFYGNCVPAGRFSLSFWNLPTPNGISPFLTYLLTSSIIGGKARQGGI